MITELYKGKGKPATHTNSYRPITLMSVIDKCYDRIMANRLSEHLETNDLLHEAQNAFRPGRDCLEHVFSLHTIAQRRREQGLDTYFFFNDLEKAYDTTWRAAILHKLAEKGVRGKFLRVLADLLRGTTACVAQGGAFSREFEFTQGVVQGGTLSPILFNVFIDGLLEDVWAHHPGVPLEQAGGAPGKLPALMVADDFAGVAGSRAELQTLVDRVYEYQRVWRIKSNVDKLRVMVIKGKPRRGAARAVTPADDVAIRWGGPSGGVVPHVQEYTYMGITLHESCTWEAQMRRAINKTHACAGALAAVLRRRGASAQLKRMLILALVRPVTEWGAQVWRPNCGDLPRLDSAQADLLKSALHLPATTCHSALLVEMGMRPMSMWFDQRVLEMWHRLHAMPATRIVKQVVFGPGAGGLPSGGRAGNRQRTWLDHAAKIIQSWQIDTTEALRMSKMQFKRLLRDQSLGVWERRLEAERRDRSVLDACLTRGGPGMVQLKAPMDYLRGGAACNRGLELILQARIGSLPLASHTGKFGRSRRDCPDDPAHFCCRACAGAAESLDHFLLDCPAYAADREEFLRQLQGTVEPARWRALQALSGLDKAFALIDDAAMGPKIVPEIVAPFIYSAWKVRTEIRSSERGADGSDAMA